jgi:hypothetical protein
MAPNAKFISSGWSKTFCMEPNFVKIPIIGGIKIIKKKIKTAETYRVYFNGFLVDHLFNRLDSLPGTLMLLNFRGFFSKENLNRLYWYISCTISDGFFFVGLPRNI